MKIYLPVIVKVCAYKRLFSLFFRQNLANR